MGQFNNSCAGFALDSAPDSVLHYNPSDGNAVHVQAF